MDDGQESAWPNLALRAEIRPYIEKNSINTQFGFKSCHRRHLRRKVFGCHCSFSRDGKNSLGFQALGSSGGSLLLPCWPWGESENVDPLLHAIKVAGVRRAKSQGQCVCGKANGFVSRFPKKMLRFAARPVLAIFNLIGASPDVAFSG